MPDDIMNESVCWQCGAPADPGFAYKQNLNARSGAYKDGGGFPVKRGTWQDVVQVRVPRCETCRTINQITAMLIFAGFMGGGVIGGMDFPSRGWTSIVGAIAGVLPVVVGLSLWNRVTGRRSVGSYPPLKRLRREGWREPD